MNQEERQQSEFNSSVSYLNRLNQWFYLAGRARMDIDGFNWLQAIVLIYAELSTEMKDKEIEEVHEELKKIYPLVMQNESKGKSNKLPQDLWFMLHNFELKLRKVMRESGLQQKLREEFEIDL